MESINPTLCRMHDLLCQTASTSRQQERRTCALHVLLHPCRYTLAGACQLLEQGLGSKLETVLQLFDRDPCRVELSQQWRPFTSLRDGQPWGPPLTRMQVLQASLAQFLRDASDVTQVGHKGRIATELLGELRQRISCTDRCEACLVCLGPLCRCRSGLRLWAGSWTTDGASCHLPAAIHYQCCNVHVGPPAACMPWCWA